jgi:hypothetical protein
MPAYKGLYDPRYLSAGWPRPLAAITLGVAAPSTKAIWRTTQFASDRSQRRRFALLIIAVFHRQPHRALAKRG